MDERIEADQGAGDTEHEPYEAPELRALADVEDSTLSFETGASDGIGGSV
jgi:hypothetical protein